MSDIRWKVIEFNIDGFGKRKILIVNCGDNYWIKSGNIINAIAIGEFGFKIVGIGAKNYKNNIFDIIMKLKNEIAEEKLDWKFKDKQKIKVYKK